MAVAKRKLKPIEQCPDGHYYNSSRTGEICAVCGKKLDPEEPEISEDGSTLLLDEKDWACGCIICVSGASKGQVYAIKDGKNFVGTSSAMDIQILGDRKIEKKNHALIMYDSRQKKTMLIPSDSRGMVYLQEKAIFEPVALEPYDEIEIGESVFKFLPFCGTEFSW